MNRDAWGLADPDGSLWHETFAFKKRAIDFAVRRCMWAGDYERLATNSARWAFAYRAGYRIVRVTISRKRP